ncbi:MAG: N-acetyltransferase family protein [Mycobacteriales bacterium]|nr:GNAT family N-acetyltransferase [Frankia sp.]
MLDVRRGGPADIEPAIAVWRAANEARRGGIPVRAEHESRVRSYAGRPDNFLVVAEDNGMFVGMALGMQGLADDGAGPPIAGLCHIGLVFVAPARWGEGIGRRVVEATLREARAAGYDRAQLWTHADNIRAQRLYAGTGFRLSGRTKDDDEGAPIVHFERAL